VKYQTQRARKPLGLLSAIAAGTLSLAASIPSWAGDAEIKSAIETLYPTAKVTGIAQTAMKGMFEVTIGQEVVYADESGKFLFFGPMVDAASKKNLTEVTKERLSRIDFKDLPLDLAVKTVKGDGSRVFATFEDPNCGFCKKMHDSLKNVDNYTLYSFLTPILSEDSKAKSKAIWCSTDRSSALRSWMQSSIVPTSTTCDAPVGKWLELAQRLGVKGTPTLFFADGRRSPGYISEQQLEAYLNASKSVKLAKN